MSRARRLRQYFYHVNHFGQLYCLGESPIVDKLPFGPAYLKDAKFLDFFFRNLRFRPGMFADYPHCSVCGIEENFVRSARTPIVYRMLSDDGQHLVHAHSLLVPFDPSSLLVRNGELYHAPPASLPPETPMLVHTELASLFFNNITVLDNCTHVLTWNDKQIAIQKS